ncbi:MAG: transcription elongation factor GreA [Coriobacteriia bacterium]|nr:transcription elongation factor GreA [Coriobacteriia bacterium]
MQKEVALTVEGQTKLEDELRRLETVRRREVGERIKEAKEFGDISENSEYEDAKNEQAWVESRIIEINLILANATIIRKPRSAPSKVTLGCSVLLKDIETGEEQKYQVVGSAEADPAENRISNESPVGQAIMGHAKGDVVHVETPRGSTIEFEIVRIAR